MLKFHLGKIVDWTAINSAMVRRAAREFFGPDTKILPANYEEQLVSLFNEWLIFDYVDPAGRSVAEEYFLINPDGLSKEILDELRQILDTQYYGHFEVQKLKPGQWMEVLDVYGGKTYRVSEVSLSKNLNDTEVCFFNRLAMVNGIYYFIGSDPVVFPMYYTERARRDLCSGEVPKLSPRDLLKILLSRTKNDSKINLYTNSAVKEKREQLAKTFLELVRKYHVKAGFRDLVDFILNESYSSHFADYYLDVQKIGIPEEMVFKHTQFFQDLWNYFPHKKLGGKCPADLVREQYYGK